MVGFLDTLTDSDGPALVFLHPASGLATHFRRLAPLLPEGRKVMAFENAEPTGAAPSISGLAASYWERLRGRITGPIDFVGWSFGGSVALELATLAQGEDVPVSSVVLLDSGAPNVMRSGGAPSLRDIAGIFGVEPSDLPKDVNPDTAREKLDLVAQTLAQTQGMHTIEGDDLRPFFDNFLWHQQVVRKPWAFSGAALEVHLVRAREEQCWDSFPDDLGWSDALGFPPKLWWTAGTHHTLASDKHAQTLVQLLRNIIWREGVT